MSTARKLGLLGLTVLSLYLLCAAGALQPEGRIHTVIVPGGLLPVSAQAESAPAPSPPPPASPVAWWSDAPVAEEARQVLDSTPEQELRETSLRGGLSIKNETSYEVDAAALLREGPGLRLPAEGPQILIIHTHGSEAYTPAGLDRYEASDSCRTQDPQYSVIRIGDELASRLEQAGLRVIHDREIYDYPSYTGSYTRSGQAVEAYLAQYPDIAVVLDVHRDALGSDDVVYKTLAEEEGVCASQVMLLAGSDDSGLEHPNWRRNLALALYLQQAVDYLHPTLMRPVELVPQRYNQHLCPGSLILEVGSSGNTLQEALAAIRLFAEAAGPALASLG